MKIVFYYAMYEPMLFQAVIAGSISSSCCFIQLILAVISTYVSIPLGCAGFNKVLGPLRPYTRTGTVAWLISTWFSILKSGKEVPKIKKEDNNVTNVCCKETQTQTQTLNHNVKKIMSTIVCLGLMFMPEILKMLGGPAIVASLDEKHIIKLEYTVDNMGCEACVYSVQGVLTIQSGVALAKITDFDLGEIEIYINKDWINDYEKETFENNLNETLLSSGFSLHDRGWKTKKCFLMRVIQVQVIAILISFKQQYNTNYGRSSYINK